MLRKFYNIFLSQDADFTRRLQKTLHFTPSNIDLYKQAFYHRSNQELQNPIVQDNERLEFLGDSVLSTVVADYLFMKYPGSDEGFLTKMRAKIVKRKTLNIIGEKMGLDVFLLELNDVQLSRSMLGNALEALIGAIYIEKGYLFTHQLITNDILKRYIDIETLETYNDNFKSQLLEWSQKNGYSIEYKLIKQFKNENRDCFKVGVCLNNDLITTSIGFNKKAAEQQASKLALHKLNIKDLTKVTENPIL